MSTVSSVSRRDYHWTCTSHSSETIFNDNVIVFQFALCDANRVCLFDALFNRAIIQARPHYALAWNMNTVLKHIITIVFQDEYPTRILFFPFILPATSSRRGFLLCLKRVWCTYGISMRTLKRWVLYTNIFQCIFYYAQTRSFINWIDFFQAWHASWSIKRSSLESIWSVVFIRLSVECSLFSHQNIYDVVTSNCWLITDRFVNGNWIVFFIPAKNSCMFRFFWNWNLYLFYTLFVKYPYNPWKECVLLLATSTKCVRLFTFVSYFMSPS